MSNSIVNLDYLLTRSAAVEFESEPIHTYFNVASIAFQVMYMTAPVQGTWYVEGSIFSDPYLWEVLQDCDPLEIAVTQPGHSIIAIPQTALYQEWLRLRWKPASGSAGEIAAALRILPI